MSSITWNHEIYSCLLKIEKIKKIVKMHAQRNNGSKRLLKSGFYHLKKVQRRFSKIRVIWMKMILKTQFKTCKITRKTIGVQKEEVSVHQSGHFQSTAWGCDCDCIIGDSRRCCYFLRIYPFCSLVCIQVLCITVFPCPIHFLETSCVQTHFLQFWH